MIRSDDHSDTYAAIDRTANPMPFHDWLKEFDPAPARPSGSNGRTIGWAHRRQHDNRVWRRIVALAILYATYLLGDWRRADGFGVVGPTRTKLTSVDDLVADALEKAQATPVSSAGPDDVGGDTDSPRPRDRSSEPAVDAHGGPVEVTRSSVTDAVTGADDSGRGSAVGGRAAALTEEQGRAFLEHLQSAVANDARLAQRDAETLRSRETVVFRAMVGAGVFTFFLVVLGVVLALTGMVAVGVFSAAVAVLPGAGTAIFRNVGGSLREQRNERNRAASEDKRVLRAVQATMAIPDSAARNAAMAGLADNFSRRVMTKPGE